MNKAEICEIETHEELKLAIRMVQERAKALNEENEDDYLEDHGGNADISMAPLLAACRILRECKARHIAAVLEYGREHERIMTEAAGDDFRRRQSAAHTAVAAAVASGDLVRPMNCERCQTQAANLVAHHHDYDRPLDVEWLCRPCHGKHHAENGSAR